MTARPIIFSAPMIRALLSGTKTQTRRTNALQYVNNNPRGWSVTHVPNNEHACDWNFVADGFGYSVDCPYGKPGDLLWVREAICVGYEIGRGEFTAIPFDGCEKFRKAFYRATDDDKPDEAKRPWRPSIHMPRWASRLTLRITDVRVERVEAISENDAVAEGPPCWVCGGSVDGLSENERGCFHSRKEALPSFALLWDLINGDGSFDSAPWVWVLTFEAIKANVDDVMRKVAA